MASAYRASSRLAVRAAAARAPRAARLRLAAPELESPEFALDADQDEKGLSNSMGLFLQKTNIIRDYLEV